MTFLNSLFGKKRVGLLEDSNPSLVRAMEKIALHDNPSNRRKLYEAFLGSILFIPVREIPPIVGPGLQTTKTQVQLPLTVLLDPSQHRVTPAFTDVEALRNWDPSTPYLGIKAQELFRFVLGTDIEEIVVNLFDPVRKMIRAGGSLTHWEIEVLATGSIPERTAGGSAKINLKAGQETMIGAPAQELRAEVEEALRRVANSIESIEEVYLFQMATRGGSDWFSHRAIGIQVDKSTMRYHANEIARQMGETIQSKLTKDESLDFLTLSGDFGQQVKKNGILVFKRST